jgi:hypothetical protein
MSARGARVDAGALAAIGAPIPFQFARVCLLSARYAGAKLRGALGLIGGGGV